MIKFQVPNPKFQESSKLQVSGAMIWNLDIGVSLRFGHWSLEFLA
jgi:hypothetical protein